MKEIIPIVSVLIGGLLGYLVSYLTNRQSNNFQREHEQIIFRRKKREELFYLVAKIKRQYRGWMGDCINKITYDKELNFGSNEDVAKWDELDMYVNLYFREDHGQTLKKISEKGELVGKTLLEVISFKSSNREKEKELNSKVIAAFMSLDQDIEKFLSEIADKK